MSEPRVPLIVPADVDDAGLDPLEFRGLCHFARRAGKVGGEFYGGRSGAARTCRMSVSAWKRVLARLIALHAIEVLEEVAGRPTRYRYLGLTGISQNPVLTEPGSQRTTPRSPQNRDPVLTEPPTRSPQNHKGVPLKESPKESPEGSSPPGARTVVVAEVIPAGEWSREACDDWIARFRGTAPGGRIGRALKPLVKEHGWSAVRAAWRSYLTQVEDQFASAERFAQTYGRWSGSVPQPQQQRATVGDANMAAAARFIRRGER